MYRLKPLLVDKVKAVIDKLTKADEQLAIVAINDAKNTCEHAQHAIKHAQKPPKK